MAVVSLLFLAVVVSATVHAADVPLNDFIGHFEGLTYSKNELIRNHERLKRTTSGKRHVELKFTALKKNFHFELYPDTSVFSDDFKLSVDGRERRDADMTVYYSGRAVGNPRTTIRGDVSHGVFVGTITTPDEDYHIEPASHHFKEEQPFHSVIYRSSDVRYDAIKGQPCGLSDHTIIKKMAEDQRRAMSAASFTDHTVQKRQAPDRTLTRCSLFLIGDQRFFEQVTTPTLAENQRITQAKAYFSRAVSRLNAIYESTVFYGNSGSGGDGIGFEIKQVEIITTDMGFFANNFIGVQAFLERHSRPQSGDQTFSVDFADYCAVYRFTYRDFADGVLGLAYVAQPGTTGGGGICSPTLNTGIVTLLNFGRRVPENINHLTFAHELGHNFGSGHDSRGDARCAPGAPSGNFIMFESSSNGNEPNNDNFSPCSTASMDSIISGRAQAGPRACFTEDRGTCGNGVLDPGEECDCIISNRDMGTCTDQCCTSNCTLKTTAQCSPQVDTCCTDTCMVDMDTTRVCFTESECANESRCDGINARCPTPDFKTGENGTALPCLNNTGTCVNETCTGSLCLLFGLEECQCTTAGDACSLCCRMMGSQDMCQSITQLAQSMSMPANLSGLTSLPPGGFCLINGETGYCDFTGQCRPVDGNGALNKLADFFQSAFFQNALAWIQNMWWVLVIAVVVLLIIMFSIVLICHFTLPKPKHLKERTKYRDSIRAHRASQRGIRRGQRPPQASNYNQAPPYQSYEMYDNKY